MTIEQLENFEQLASRAVACKHWRWMPGMLSDKGLRVTRCDDDGYIVGYYEHLSYVAECVKGSTPDLRDPATIGCLLALVREAWEPYRNGDPICSTFQWTDRWGVGAIVPTGFAPIVLSTYPTEVMALVAALEAAP